jgi:hypothetical protein
MVIDNPIAIEWQFTPAPPLVAAMPGRVLGYGSRQFYPIDHGEIDNFAFDFTSAVGNASIVSTSWTCRLAPFQTIVDFSAQSRVLSVSAQTMIVMRGMQLPKNGFFSVAEIGGFLASSIGATYTLEATTNLSDGRVLTYSSTVLVKPFGP